MMRAANQVQEVGLPDSQGPKGTVASGLGERMRVRKFEDILGLTIQ
jgi:hypothetical protein